MATEVRRERPLGESDDRDLAYARIGGDVSYDGSLDTLVRRLRSSSYGRVQLRTDGLALDLRRGASGGVGSVPGQPSDEGGSPTVGVTAPTLGVATVRVSPGDLVSVGQVLVDLQVHRRTVPVVAHQDARVSHIDVADGGLVDHGQLLLSLETQAT